MARVKTAEERGPVGAWAYEARVERELSVEQVIERLPTRYHPATLRKVESGSSQPGRRMLRELAALYGVEAPGEPLAPTTELSELAASIRDLARAIQEERAERLEWERGVLESIASLAQWLSRQDDPAPVPLEDGRGAR